MILRVLRLVLPALFLATAAQAQAPSTAQVYLMRIWQQGVGTPDNMGFLPLAETEAKAALLHANKALDAFGDKATVARELGEVVYALDPAKQAKGTALGYGVAHAAASILAYMEIARTRPDASDNVKQNSDAIMQSADHAVQMARQAQNLAEEFRKTAGEPKDKLVTLRDDIVVALSGRDMDGDGKIAPREGGLAQVRTALAKVLKAEGF